MRPSAVEGTTAAVSAGMVAIGAACLLVHGLLLKVGAFDAFGSLTAAPVLAAAMWLLAWTLMFGAMMLPSAAPFLIAVRRAGGGAGAAVTGFSAVWLAVGLALLAALMLAGEGLSRLPPGAPERLAGVALLLAALYAASPLASACQRACADPRGILARRWRGAATRRTDAIRAGVDYGLRCLGCCIPMLAVMLLVGMHDARWTILMAIQMTLLKSRWSGSAVAIGTAVLCAAASVALLAGWWSPPLRSLRALCGL